MLPRKFAIAFPMLDTRLTVRRSTILAKFQHSVQEDLVPAEYCRDEEKGALCAKQDMKLGNLITSEVGSIDLQIYE
jgi:hypothetical protein